MAQEEDLGSASTESRENNSREVKQEQSESKIVERIEQPVFDCGGTQADEVFRATSIEESGDTGSRSDLPQSELKRAIEYLKSDELDQVGGDAQWNTMARSYKIEQIEEGLNGSKRLQMVSNFGLDQGDEVPISVEEWKPVGLNQALKRSYEIGVTTALVMKDAVTALNKDNPSDISRLVHSVKQMTIHAAAIEGRVPISELIFQRVLAPGKKSAQTIGSIFPTSLFRCSLKVFKELPQEKEERVESKANLFERTLEQLSHDFPVRMDFPIAESIELTIQIPERKMQSVGKKAWKQLARSDVSSVASSLRSLERMRETRQKLGGFLVQMNKDTPQLADTMLNCAMKMIYQKPEDVCSVVQAKQRPNVRQLVVRIQSKTPQKVGSPQSRRKAYSPLTMTRVASLKQEFKIQTQSCYTKIWDRFQKGKSLGKGTFSDVYWALQWGEGGVIQEK